MIVYIRKILHGVGVVEKVITVIAFIAMALLLVADLVGREVFNQGIFGATQVAAYIMAVGAFAGFGLATAGGEHLRPQFADNWLPSRWDGVIQRLSSLLSACVLIGIAYAAVTLVIGSYQFQLRSGALNWLVWPVQIVMPIGFALSGIRYLSYFVFPDLRPSPKEITE